MRSVVADNLPAHGWVSDQRNRTVHLYASNLLPIAGSAKNGHRGLRGARAVAAVQAGPRGKPVEPQIEADDEKQRRAARPGVMIGRGKNQRCVASEERSDLPELVVHALESAPVLHRLVPGAEPVAGRMRNNEANPKKRRG